MRISKTFYLDVDLLSKLSEARTELAEKKDIPLRESPFLEYIIKIGLKHFNLE